MPRIYGSTSYSHNMIQQSFLKKVFSSCLQKVFVFLEAKVQAQLQQKRCEKAKQDLSNGRKAGGARLLYGQHGFI